MAPELGADTPSPPAWSWILLGLLLAAVIAAGLLWQSGRRPGESGGGGAPPALEVLGEVPDFALLDAEGRPFARAALAGRVWVAGFVFTRCNTLCPKVMARLAGLEGAADLVVFTVDPDWDRPEVLKGYAEAHRAMPPRWRFLTGEREAMYRLVKEGFKLSVAANPAAAQPGDLITHSDRLMLVDGGFRIRGAYSSGDPDDMRRLREDLAVLTAAAP